MGNGPGNIKEYIDIFHKYPRCQGGFAWEWANHGLLTKDKTTGDEYYGYGGDFGEKVHDSTFVMDGLLFSDHTPNPGLLEYAKAIEPVQLLHSDSATAIFINRYDFLNLDHLHLTWHAVNETGDASETGHLDIPSNLAPGQDFLVDLPRFTSAKSEIVVHLAFKLKKATISLPKDFTVATADVVVHPSHTLTVPSPSSSSLQVSHPAPHTLRIETSSTEWTFSTLYGSLTSWRKSDVELIKSPPTLSITRAETDNDAPQDGWNWRDKNVHLAKPYTRRVSHAQPDAHTFVVTVHQQIVPPVLEWAIDVVLTYTFSSSGSVSAHVKGSPRGKNLPGTFPRIGFVMELPGEFQGVEWFGRGPGESYRDSKEGQLVGLYAVGKVDELWTEYEVPQEGANRTDTRWVKVSTTSSSSASASGKKKETTLLAQFVEGGKRKLFDFQASHYRMEDVAAAGHPYELHKKKREEVVLRLDAAHHGLGTGSCGPKTLPQYALYSGPFEFEVVLQ